MTLQWLETGGGPFIILDRGLLSHWVGAQSDDYERACAIQNYMSLVEVGAAEALVLSGDLMPLTFRAAHNPPLTIFRSQWAASDEAEDQHVREFRLDAANECEPSLTLELRNSEPMILDAAGNGQEPTAFDSASTPTRPKTFQLPLIEGTYVVDCKRYEPDDETSMIVHQFHRA